MSVDNVPAVDPRVQYVAAAAQTAFDYPFPIFADADIVVDVDGVTKTLTTHYSVSGEGNDTGGTVTFLVAPGAGAVVTIYRNVAIERISDFQQNGPLSSVAFNDELDKITMWMQQIESRVGRAVRLSLTNPQASSALELGASFEGRFLFVNSSGALEPAASVTATTLTQSIIGQLYRPINAFETAALITPTNYFEDYGVLERYGLIGNGVADDSAAFANAALVSAQGQKLYGTPGKTYRLNSAITLGAIFDIDLRGATIKPTGDHLCFNSTITNDFTATISGAITIGTRTCVVTSATGLAAGQWTFITYSDSPTNNPAAYPPSWAKITNVAGTTITFDRAFQATYPAGAATATLNVFNNATLKTRCIIKNGIIDGSASTYSGGTLGRALRLVGYKKVDLDVDLAGWSTTSANGDLIIVFQCQSVRMKLESIGNQSGSQVLNIIDCMAARLTESVIDGDSFGAAFTRCDFASAIGNQFNGRRKQNDDDSVSPVRSIRGLKAYGCKKVIFTGNDIADYESPIKVEACHRWIVTSNSVTNAGLTAVYDGSVALNIGQTVDGNISGYGIVSNNTVENCGGVAISIGSSPSIGRNIISQNIIKGCQGIGIHTICRNSIISLNQIADWGLRNSSDAGIHLDSGATIIGNRFYHATLTGLSCIRNEIDATFYYVSRDNVGEDGNPLGLVMENNGSATIASGSTSVAVTHGLSRTPQGSEITLTMGGNPTNDVGFLYISAVGATTFTINSRADPGASGLSVGWKVHHIPVT